MKTNIAALADFHAGIAGAQTEAEVFEIIDLMPITFQDGLWRFMGNQELELTALMKMCNELASAVWADSNDNL